MFSVFCSSLLEFNPFKDCLRFVDQLLGLHRFTMTVLQIIEDPIVFHILGKPPFWKTFPKFQDVGNVVR